MEKLETHQNFNPAIKIAGIEEEKRQETAASEDPTPFPVKESGNDEPRNSEPRNDEPKNDEPRNDEPRNSEPRNDEPRNSEPRNDEPRNDEPRNDADRSDLGLSMFDEEDSVAEKVQKPKPQGDLENMFATNN